MKALHILCLVLLGSAILSSCKKSEYLVDGGIHSANTPLNTFDYLNQHPAKLFDTLCVVIDKLNMRDEVNNAGTFFAPTDYSVKRFIDLQKIKRDENTPYTLDTLVKYITRDSVAQYLFKEKINLASAPTTLTQILSVNNEVYDYRKVLQPKDGGAWSGADIYYLYLTKIKGTRDIVGSTVPASEADVTVSCQTTGIETSSGTTLNVLNNGHFFIRF